MKRTLSLFLMLVLLLLAGCNDPKPLTDALHRAEALMGEDPDSAWAVLNALSPDEMGQSRTRAHYALLYTQAQDKTYRDETNDSLIQGSGRMLRVAMVMELLAICLLVGIGIMILL